MFVRVATSLGVYFCYLLFILVVFYASPITAQTTSYGLINTLTGNGQTALTRTFWRTYEQGEPASTSLVITSSVFSNADGTTTPAPGTLGTSRFIVDTATFSPTRNQVITSPVASLPLSNTVRGTFTTNPNLVSSVRPSVSVSTGGATTITFWVPQETSTSGFFAPSRSVTESASFITSLPVSRSRSRSSGESTFAQSSSPVRSTLSLASNSLSSFTSGSGFSTSYRSLTASRTLVPTIQAESTSPASLSAGSIRVSTTAISGTSSSTLSALFVGSTSASSAYSSLIVASASSSLASESSSLVSQSSRSRAQSLSSLASSMASAGISSAGGPPLTRTGESTLIISSPPVQISTPLPPGSVSSLSASMSLRSSIAIQTYPSGPGTSNTIAEATTGVVSSSPTATTTREILQSSPSINLSESRGSRTSSASRSGAESLSQSTAPPRGSASQDGQTSTRLSVPSSMPSASTRSQSILVPSISPSPSVTYSSSLSILSSMYSRGPFTTSYRYLNTTVSQSSVIRSSVETVFSTSGQTSSQSISETTVDSESSSSLIASISLSSGSVSLTAFTSEGQTPPSSLSLQESISSAQRRSTVASTPSASLASVSAARTSLSSGLSRFSQSSSGGSVFPTTQVFGSVTFAISGPSSQVSSGSFSGASLRTQSTGAGASTISVTPVEASSTIAFTPSRISSSATSSATPSVITCFLTFDRNTNDNSTPSTPANATIPRKAKRVIERVFLVLDSDGRVSITNTCSDALIFTIGTDMRLTAQGLTAYATLGDIALGFSDFKFGASNVANVEQSFTYPGGLISWDSPLFRGDNRAVFGFPTSGVGVVVVAYNGIVPPGYSEQSLRVVVSDDPEFLCGQSSISVGPPRTSQLATGSQLPVFTEESSVPFETGLTRVVSSTPTQIPSIIVSVTEYVETSSSTPILTGLSGTVTTPSTPTSPSAWMTSTILTTVTRTITSCHPTKTNCHPGQVTTEVISLTTTVCPATPEPQPTATPPPDWTASTVYTTITYTVTACPATVKDCPLGHVTTKTIDVYTTVCPIDAPAPAKTEPARVIGVLVTIVVDITAEINIRDGVAETLYHTQTLTRDSQELYGHATADQPCYPCQITSAGYECPTSEATVTRTLVISSPSDAPVADTPLVLQPCPTCSAMTVNNNLGNIAPDVPTQKDVNMAPAVPTQKDVDMASAAPAQKDVDMAPAVPTQKDVDSADRKAHPESPKESPVTHVIHVSHVSHDSPVTPVPSVPANGTWDLGESSGSNHAAPNITAPVSAMSVAVGRASRSMGLGLLFAVGAIALLL